MQTSRFADGAHVSAERKISVLVSELRGLLSHYQAEDLRVLVAEMYKSMPKKLREEKDIDRMIQNVQEHIRTRKTERNEGIQADMLLLRPVVEEFLEYAYQQYYFAPNSYVHKKERPKWRFKVKAFIKDLQSIPVEDEDGAAATDLLDKLYRMLCYACCYYIFNTEDPFRSVGIGQIELLNIITARRLRAGVHRDSIRAVLELVVLQGVDREVTHSKLMREVIGLLRTPDSKQMAIEQCKALSIQIRSEKPQKTKGDDSMRSYVRDEKQSNLAEMVFRLHGTLGEFEEGIQYYRANLVERNPEVALYKLLSLLHELRQLDWCMRVYEEALKKGIQPRQMLINLYNYGREMNALPERMYL